MSPRKFRININFMIKLFLMIIPLIFFAIWVSIYLSQGFIDVHIFFLSLTFFSIFMSYVFLYSYFLEVRYITKKTKKIFIFVPVWYAWNIGAVLSALILWLVFHENIVLFIIVTIFIFISLVIGISKIRKGRKKYKL
ncbi:MAG: hypothetical protein ACTSRZ_18140 [Promethearchaeota archaeon]